RRRLAGAGPAAPLPARDRAAHRPVCGEPASRAGARGGGVGDMSDALRHIAQLNIGRLRHETDDPRMADFMNNLARINALAERSPGFVWRYTDATGNATDTRPYDGDPRMAINMSVWESVEALEKFVWQTVHTRFYGRKHEWFEKLDGAYF